MKNTNPLNQLPFLKDFKAGQESSYDRTGGNDDFVSLEAGEKAVVADLTGPGRIARIWMTVASPDLYILRDAVVRMYWDDERHPSVECPIGDFFGIGFALNRHYTALPLGMSSGGFYCYFSMPFAKRARIEVENQSDKKIYALYYHVSYEKFASLPKDTAYFHANWRHEKTKKNENYTLLDAEGQGHYIGCNMSMQGKYPFWFWFLEGDEMIYVDGENHPPAYHGTGTEDYFNSGWYFDKGEFAAPYHGLTLKDHLRARICAYRFHIEDPIPFNKSILATIEHGGTNDADGSDYSSVAYWYQTEPHKYTGMLPGAAERRPPDVFHERLAKQAATEILDVAFRIGNRIRNVLTPGRS